MYVCVCVPRLENPQDDDHPEKVFLRREYKRQRARCIPVCAVAGRGRRARIVCASENWFFHPGERVRAAFSNYWFKTPVVCLKLEMEIALETRRVAFLALSPLFSSYSPQHPLFSLAHSPLFLSVRNFYNSAHPLFDSCLIYFFQDFRAGGTHFLQGINLSLL